MTFHPLKVRAAPLAGLAALTLPWLARAGNLDLPTVPIPLPSPLLSPTVSSGNNTLQQVCGLLKAAPDLTGAQKDLLNTCNFLADPNASPNALRNAYQAILGQQINALEPQVKLFSSALGDSLSERLLELRHGDMAGLGLQDHSRLFAAIGPQLLSLLPMASSASPSFMDGRLGVYVNGNVESGSREQSQNSHAYDVRNSAVAVGLDYRFTRSLVAGLAYEGSSGGVSFAGDAGRMDLRENGLSLYGSFYKGAFYADLLAGVGRTRIDSTRNLQFLNTSSSALISQQAQGSSHVQQVWAGLSLGNELNWGSLSLTPEASLTYRRGRLDAYTEQMSQPDAAGAGLALSYGSTTVPSLQARLGLHAGWTLSMAWGVLQPQLHGAYVRELRDAPDTFSASFAAAASLGGNAATPIGIASDPSTSHYYAAGAGITATFGYGLAAFVDYERLVSTQYTRSHQISLGLRYQAGD